MFINILVAKTTLGKRVIADYTLVIPLSIWENCFTETGTVALHVLKKFACNPERYDLSKISHHIPSEME
jgi:hypothetical protein